MTKARLVVLISGSGTNLQAVLDACRSGRLPAQVVAVISNVGDAYGLERARQAEVPAHFLARAPAEPRARYDRRLAKLVAPYQPDWIVMAGWMRILGLDFLDRFAQRVVNLHPALPGMFPGMHAIQRAHEALQRGEITHTGVMVHLVPDEGVDNGPVLNKEVVQLHAGESLASLEARVHKVEHRLLVDTLRELISGVSLEGTPT
jgi:phosphoribosylglycinamide formyltransferase-1